MKREDILDIVIEKISIVYREKQNEYNTIHNHIRSLEEQLTDENISHAQFLKIEKELLLKQDECIEIRCIADGIAQARESIFALYGN